MEKRNIASERQLTSEGNGAGGISRRQFLQALSATGAVAVVGAGTVTASGCASSRYRSNAHIVISGGGAGGLTTANKLVRALDGVRITIIEPREVHQYQPGYTLLGSGVYDSKSAVESPTGRYIPDGVRWVKSVVAEYDPDANTVTTADGKKIRYDYLVVASGCQLNYHHIEGMERRLVGSNGIGSNYAGSDGALATWGEVQKFVERGGVGLFTKPNTPLKCAGAPLKATFLTESRMAEAGTRGKAQIFYNHDSDRLFSVSVFHELASTRFAQKGVDVNNRHVLTAIDPGAKRATFDTPNGGVTMDYDYIHIVPPMSAPDTVAHSALAWTDGPFAKGGWLEVDRHTLQHRRYGNVFGVGDVVGTPVGKTAASVKAQAPVVADNLVAVMQGKPLPSAYNGYTSCPLITGLGRASLVEFDYDLNLVPSFPGNPVPDRWRWWQMKVHAIRPFYYQTLMGRIPA